MQEAVAAYTDARGRETAPADVSRRRISRSSSRPIASSRGRGSISRRSRCSCRVATSDSAKLIRAARAGLAALWRPGYRYKKAGVLLLDLHPANRVQESLFDRTRRCAPHHPHAHDRQTQPRHGRDTVSFAAAGIRRPWKMQRDRLSPCYTTDWEELLRV